MEKEIITVGEVAALLRISKTRVRHKAASGDLPAKKIPGGREMTTAINKKFNELSSQQIDQIAAVLARLFIAKAEQILHSEHGFCDRGVRRPDDSAVD